MLTEHVVSGRADVTAWLIAEMQRRQHWVYSNPSKLRSNIWRGYIARVTRRTDVHAADPELKSFRAALGRILDQHRLPWMPWGIRGLLRFNTRKTTS